MRNEIISGPLDVWIAALAANATEGQDAPAAVDTDPPGGTWTRLSSGGTRNMTEEGLTIRHPQEFFEVKVAGDTATQKVYRTSEGLSVAFTLYDLRMDAYRRVLDNNMEITSVADEKGVSLFRGTGVQLYSLIIRGTMSPEEDGMNARAQYWVPMAYQSGQPEPVFTKGEAAGLAFEFMAIRDPGNANYPFGTFRYTTG